MTAFARVDVAETVIAELQALGPELRQGGIVEMSLFGSLARGEARADSELERAAAAALARLPPRDQGPANRPGAPGKDCPS